MNDDILLWKQLSALLVLCEGNSPVPSGSPSQRATDTELWYFIWCQPVQTAEQTVKMQVNKYILVLIWRPCNASYAPVDYKERNDQSINLNDILTWESHRWHTLPVYVWDSKPMYSFPSTVFLHVVRSVKRNDGFGKHGIRIFDRSSQATTVLTIPSFKSSPPEIKWPPFRRRCFHIHFREWNVLYFD